MVKIIISGALGRMGKRITELAGKDPELKVVGKIELKANPDLGIVDDLNKINGDYDCIIEFTSPKATIEHLKQAEKLKKAMVIGTTGMSKEETNMIISASNHIPIVFSPNMSVGVNVVFNLIGKVSSIFKKDYKPNIVETHHIHKKDKPSGTAKLMADIVREKSGLKDVPIESIREGEVVGDHEITFESELDTIKISHRAKTRDILVLGALKAAKFIKGKKKGLFSMSDVLNI